MSDFGKDLFDHAVQTTKDYAKVAVENYRAGQRATLTHVWLLWGDQSVLGTFRTEGAALEAMTLMPETVKARIERRMLGD